MNHNLLISKYLDGDLSQLEDNDLRRLLSEDSVIKEEFDTATMLHFLMKEDAESINPPLDFFLKTEELILGKYASLPSTMVDSNKRATAKSTRKLSSIVALLLLLLVLPFGDTQFGVMQSFTSYVPEDLFQSSSANSRSLNTSGTAIHHNKMQYSTIHSNSSKDYFSPNTSASDNHSDLYNIQYGSKNGATLSSSNLEPNQKTLLGSLNNSNNENSIYQKETMGENSLNKLEIIELTDPPIHQLPKNHLTNTSNTTLGFHPLVASIQPDQSKGQEIQVSTFVSNTISLPGNYTSSSANFSQSIAYSLGEDNRVGMEVGYFGYTYQDGGTVLVPKSNASKLSSKILGMDDPAPGINDPKVERSSSSITNGFEEKKVEYSLEKKMYWGAAFYEHTLLNSGNISFNGRIGFGGSNDGPMAFSRAFARYNVYSGIAVTFGAEANAFMIHAPIISGKQAEITSGVSLVYGMQIKF